ncbi:response regulator [Bacillus aerolatus]|uniref:Response regulator n=1 Tax=Bacillus aerolatus TaxID=2653354 RepID=A0A6I1FI61_9BACI|nr:response regulator transcription factor [Bacillus aerolatus]KAB7705579.1 response regulator [Bacillus aerolatus]
MTKKKILIVEDEMKIARLLSLELEYEGYETDTAETGKEALQKIKSDSWDLILLDIMIPELSGIEVLRRLREDDDLTPVIFLTAKDTTLDKVSGLNQGANDYVTKPFSTEELLARIRACLRTVQKQPAALNELRTEDLTVNLYTREVQRDGTSIELTPKEFNLLVYLMENENRVLEREQIISHVWGYDYTGDTNVVDVYIRHLRKKIDDDFEHPYIQTVRGVGYSLKVKGS